MIETDKRKAVFLLHQEGHSVRQIARLLSLSRNTVRIIIAQSGAPPAPQPRADKLPLAEELLRRLYQQCQGHIARMHEKLVEE
jgi:transposase-like protein